MSNQVYANNMEVSCKSANGKSICAFPDVCFTPPMTPATPPGVPIPYPNTGMASDCTDGSKTVQISGQEVMLKDKSYFKRSTGDEAGCATKKGAVTSVNMGKVYFTMWSMDVKAEGENVVRNMDLTTHNHASPLANTPPWLYQDQMAFDQSDGKVCEEEKKKADDACKGATPHSSGKGLDCSKAKGCEKAKACVLQPKSKDKKFCCHPNTTGHHLIEVHCFSPTGERGGALENLDKYSQNAAPCVCASESRADGTHGVLHAVQGQIEGAYTSMPGGPYHEWPDAGKKIKGTNNRESAKSKWKYKDARDTGMLAHKTAFPHCNAICIKNQLDDYHKGKCGLTEESPLRTDPGARTRSSGKLSNAQKQAIDDAVDAAKGISSGGGAT